MWECVTFLAHSPPFVRRFSQNCEKKWLLASSCLSVRPSICQSAWNNSAPTERIFMKFGIWEFFRESVEKIWVSLKSDKNNGCWTWRPIYSAFTTVSRWIILRMRNISDKSCRENQNTRFMYSISPPPPENHAVYEIMWENMAGPDEPHMTIKYWTEKNGICCRIDKVRIQTHTVFNIYCSVMTAIVTRTRLVVTSCVEYITRVIESACSYECNSARCV
jgi:hypothetical protein